MNSKAFALAAMSLAALSLTACYQDFGGSGSKRSAESRAAQNGGHYFKPAQKTSEGSVTIGGERIDYQAVAGTLVVHPKGWDDAPQDEETPGTPPPAPPVGPGGLPAGNPKAEASMFYVAYFKKGAEPGTRPITFLYNGGPGSSTVWLHMGAFGPRRIVTSDDTHTPAAPYSLVNNDSSLLDVSDLVFIDAPGTGFSRIAGKDKEKTFYGVDPDAYAFSQFIAEFLSKYNRWNSPKYLFGESYGTTRSAALADLLETRENIDLNGVILLSQILCFDLSVDDAQLNPGVDIPYALALPTYAATAWYHKKAGNGADLESFLKQVEQFAMTDYIQALQAGSSLDPAKRQAVIAKLSQYTGLPADYLDKANLRVNGGEFEKTLLANADTTTGRLDTRFTGPTLDPLSEGSEYDPQASSISSAYVSAFNGYVRDVLGYGTDQTYKPEIEIYRSWEGRHLPPHTPYAPQQATNVMPDLAEAMKVNPNLKVLLNAGYFDLATPFFEGIYEMQHLPIPQSLQSNIEFRFYQSGHMVYAHAESLKQLHDNVADFIRRTDNQPKPASSP